MANTLSKILKRMTDIKYLRAYIKIRQDGKLIKQELDMLARYHKGEIKNFTEIRDLLLQRYIIYAYKNSSYYKKLIDNLNINPEKIEYIKEKWSNIPFLDKGIIKNKEMEIKALPANKEYISHITTGGSTGEPFGFDLYGGHDYEHQEFLYKIIGFEDGDKILALDGTLVSEVDLSKNIYWTKKSNNNLPYGSIALSSHYLNKTTINHYLQFIEDFKPAIIRGYPSIFEYLAKYINENKINFETKLKGIELTSESFSDQQVECISKAFKTRVFSQYGHAEASVFGYTTSKDLTIYCSPLYGFTEIIGIDGQHVDPGQIGEVVVTGFNNHATPFIRYRTGDLAMYGGEENGIVKLSKIYGRTQDVVYDSSMQEVRLTALVFGRHYHAFDNIEKWQIIQNYPGEVTFKIIKGKNFNQTDENEIKENFIKIGNIRTNFEFTDNISKTKRGKSKLLIQNIKI